MANIGNILDEAVVAKGDLLTEAEQASAVRRAVKAGQVTEGYLLPDAWAAGGELFVDVDLSGDLRVRGEHGNYKVDGIEATGRKLRYFGSSLGRGIRVRVQFADEGHVEGGSALAWLF